MERPLTPVFVLRVVSPSSTFWSEGQDQMRKISLGVSSYNKNIFLLDPVIGSMSWD